MDDAASAKTVEAEHAAAIESMTDLQRLAMAREILGAMIREKAGAKQVFVTRIESLQAVFDAEAKALNQGAQPRIDFFLPLDRSLPLQAMQ